MSTVVPQTADETASENADVTVKPAGAPESAAAAAAPQPVERPVWLRLCFIFAGLAFFITQGLGMNLVMANLYQLQGEFSATVAEVAWLSAAYMAPMPRFPSRCSRCERNMACGPLPNFRSSSSSSPHASTCS